MALIGLGLFVWVAFMALSAGSLFPNNPLDLAGRPLQWPLSNPRFWLGTDVQGRDIAAVIFYGARISLLIGVVATLIAMTIGIVIGALAGYYGGLIDEILMRLTEAFQTLPNFLLLLVLFALSNAGPVQLALWPTDLTLQAPLSVAVLVAAAVFFLLGAIVASLGSLGHRGRARRAERRVKALEEQARKAQLNPSQVRSGGSALATIDG